MAADDTATVTHWLPNDLVWLYRPIRNGAAIAKHPGRVRRVGGGMVTVELRDPLGECVLKRARPDALEARYGND